MSATIKFCFEDVTGSNILITSRNKSYQLDCGMVQGYKDISYLKNKEYYDNCFIPDYMILSHAHIDHSGNLPVLTKKGYTGKIYATPASTDLCRHMLKDSAKVASKEIPIISKTLRKHKNKTKVFPLYTEEDVEYCMKQFENVDYDIETKISDNVKFTFQDSCHILGSSSIKIDIKEKTKHRIFYTADLGHNKSMVCNEPKIPQGIDYLICESTYGNKKREEEDVLQIVSEIVHDVYKRNGRLLIPAFSVGRMQNIILVLHKLSVLGIIPDMPIYIDSPLSVKVTDLYSKYEDQINDEIISFFRSRGLDPFKGKNIKYVESVEDTEMLLNTKHPCIILSSSGMADGGKIRCFIPGILEDKNSTLLQIGYAATNSTSRRIEENQGSVTIDGESYRVKCKLEKINSLSAHADQEYLVKYIKSCVENNYLKAIFLIHGDMIAKEKLKTILNECGINNIIIAEPNKIYNLV